MGLYEMCYIVDEYNFDPFKSEAHKYIYILLYTDTKLRLHSLRITEQMYYDKSLATQWRDNIYNIINSNNDSSLDLFKQKAIYKLNELYNRMIKED